MVYLEVENATFTYPEATASSLNRASLRVQEGSFTLLCGPSGGGKTTLLRMLKPEIRPQGVWEGRITYQGRELGEEGSFEIGMIFQDPDHQIVMEEVESELLFGMENISLPADVMRKRLSEVAQLFDLDSLLHRKTDQLSGGEKQLLNLASILVMQPKVLLLDEPTAQLDPIASKQLLQMLERLNQEWGITIILVEHRLDELLPIVDQVLFLESGRVQFHGSAQRFVGWLWEGPQTIHPFLPVVPKMALAWEGYTMSKVPLSVKEGRSWWLERCPSIPLLNDSRNTKTNTVESMTLLELNEISFRYQYEQREILNYLDLQIRQGELLSILGRNGSGKSTLLHILAGHVLPQRGKVIWHQEGNVAFLPQNPRALFVHDTLELDIQSICARYATPVEERERILKELQVGSVLRCHPHDLSGGELQRAALALLLCTKPQILLLDEPTKGLDPVAKTSLLHFLRDLQGQGMSVVLVTHDLEFAVGLRSRCALLFQGQILTAGDFSDFFSESFFYTTFLTRILRGTPWSNLSSWEEFLALCSVYSTLS